MKCETISFYTLGCRLNQSETASIENAFLKDNFEVVRFDQPADVAVINTCTVTENGDADTRRLVHKVCRTNPNVRIALVGCQAQIQKDDLTKLPNVRWVVGNAQKMQFLSILKQSANNDEPEVITPTIDNKPFTIPNLSIDHSHTRANLKIQDGCDFFCSFCEIPYARGRARSREFDDIILEARALVAAKHKELVITGINVGTYQYKNHTLMDVINALENIDGLHRIRISSIEPTTIDPTIIQKMNTNSKLCRYLHIPLQSGNDVMLEKMKRKYTVKEFSAFIEHAYTTVKNICIGTDVIVGFPGETEELFNQTVDYLREAPIHYFHVFSYSKRNLAKSKNLDEEVDKRVVAERSRILRELSARKRAVYAESQVGQNLDVLFEQKKKGFYTGLTENYCRVFVDSPEDLTNQVKTVSINDAKDSQLHATI